MEKAVPSLARHARLGTDPLSRRPVLLYPEGILELDEIAAAILALCDGSRSIGRISLALSEDYEAGLEEITQDVREYLQALSTRGLIRLEQRP